MNFTDEFNKRVQDQNKPGAYVENLGLKGTIEQNNLKLNLVCQQTALSPDFYDLKIQLAAAINAGQITAKTMSDEWASNLMMGSSYVIFKHATVYSVLAEIAYGKSETEKAWALLARSCNLCGFAEAMAGAGEANPNIGGDIKQRENARKGGKKRGDGYQPVREEIVRLLNSPPVGGWKGSLSTRKSIAKSLTEFKKTKDVTQKNFPFPTNIAAALHRWFTDCSEIRYAYEANSVEALSVSCGR